MKLQWRMSYETLKYDTPDGELHKGQFAKHGSVYLVRNHPENNNQTVVIDPRDDPDYLVKLQGLVEVGIVEGEHMYFEEFLLPSNRIVRLPIARSKYLLAKDKIPMKDLTAKQIADIVKDDDKWL